MILLHTKWSDICICNYLEVDYLVQGRKNKLTGASSFRITRFKQLAAFLSEVSGMDQKLLEKAGLWKVEPPKED